MNTKPVLSAEDVKKILAAAEAHALQNKWAVTIAVSDDGGHLLGMLLRLDGAAPISSHIAPAKAELPRAAASRACKRSSTTAVIPSCRRRCSKACWKAACRSWPMAMWSAPSACRA